MSGGGGGGTTTEYVQIKDLKAGMKNINAVFIVLEVGPVTLTKEAREVRTLRVADATASVHLSVWDAPGALLQPGDIVRLSRGYAALWRAALTLYSGKAGDLQKIGEFCMLFNEQVNMSEPQPIAAAGAGAGPGAAGAGGERANGAAGAGRGGGGGGGGGGGKQERFPGGDKLAHKTYVRTGPRQQPRGANRR